MRAAVFSLLASLSLSSPAIAQEPLPQPPAPTAAEEAAYAAIVENAVRNYILPAYGRLSEKADALATAMQAYCDTPSAESRAALKSRFSDTVAAWAEVDFFRFGAMAEDGRYERFAFFPDVHGTGARQMRRLLADEDAKLLEPGAIARQSAAVQGLPALEALLHTGSEALMTAATPDTYRCALANTVAGNLRTIAAAALESWTEAPSWTDRLENPGPENPVYRTHREAAQEMLKAVFVGVEQMRDHRLSPPAGSTPEDARPGRGAYSRSGDAMLYLAASAGAIERFVGASGMMGLVPDDGGWVGPSEREQFAELKTALAQAGPDFAVALIDPPRRDGIVRAMEVLQALREYFTVHVAVSSGLVVGFNGLDGD
jgi:predicted lipoprotein